MGMTEIKADSRVTPEFKEEADQHRQQDKGERHQRDDEAQVHPLLTRFINLPAVINFEFTLQSAWETVAVTFQFSLLNGGPASMFYGGIFWPLSAAPSWLYPSPKWLPCTASTFIDPLVGAQYRWSANFAPCASRFFGLVQGWLTVFAWIFAAAATTANLANITTAMIIFNNPSYDNKPWHTAMIMWAFLIIPLIFNLYFRRLLNTFETVGGVLHVVFFLVTIVTLTVMARRSTPDFVFKTVIHNAPGWTNPGAAFCIGLLTVVFPVAGADGVLHMSAEVKRVRTRAPASIILATVSNYTMQFAFVICLMFTIGNLTLVSETPTGLPIIEVYYLATGSIAGTNIFMVAIYLVFVVALFNVFASASRLTWAFARDHGLPFSSFFSQVNARFKMPLNSLALIMAISFVLSLIYIGSSTAFNAIMSLVSIAFHTSYVLPILFIALRKIRGPPVKYGPFKLGRWGLPVNAGALAYLILVIVWMSFPVILPVTSTNMNYAAPILIIVIIGAVADWSINGRKRFEFPIARYLPED